MPYKIKSDINGYTPIFISESGVEQNLSEPKPNKTIAEWVIDNHAKGVSDNTVRYESYTPKQETKIPLHD